VRFDQCWISSVAHILLGESANRESCMSSDDYML
jgi:hypothetical protein